MKILCSGLFALLQVFFLIYLIKPFLYKKNKKLIRNSIITVISYFLLCSMGFYLHSYFIGDSISFYKIYLIVSEIVAFLLTLLLIKDHFKSQFFVFGISANLFLLSASLSSFIGQKIHENSIVEGLVQTTSLGIVFALIFSTIFEKFFAKTMKALIIVDNKKIWKTFYFIPFMLFLVGFFCNNLDEYTNSLQTLFIKILSTTTSLLACSFFSNDYFSFLSRIKDIESIVIDLKLGCFTITIDSHNKVYMEGGESMLKVLGFKYGKTGDYYYRQWYRNIEKAYLETVRRFRHILVEKGKASVIYVWNKFGQQRLIKTTAVCIYDKKGNIIINGYHEDITNIENIEKDTDNELIIKSLGEMYYCNYYINLLDDTFISTKDQTDVRDLVGFTGKASYAMNLFIDKKIAQESKEKMRGFTDFSTVAKRLQDEKSLECEYLSIERGWCRARFLPVKKDCSGRITHILFVVTSIDLNKKKEIEAKKMLEEAFNESNKANNAKTNFLSTVSHDIRTPMNVVLGMSEIAKVNIDDKEKVAKCLDRIKSSGEYLLQLINKVLDMNKIEASSLEKCNYTFKLDELIELISTICSAKAQMKNQVLKFDIKKVFNNNVYGDNIHLQQILLNIIDNAIKYTNPNGKISVKVEEVLSYSNQIHQYIFVIEDNGIGMSEEYLKHIFEPFSREDDNRTSQVQGTGLGMAIVHKYVEFLGGDIKVKSKKNSGSKFIVTIPLQIETDYKNKELENNANIKDEFPNVNILVVDDNELNQEIICEFLNVLKCKYKTSNNGEEAIKCLTENKVGYFQMILMDVRMPILDGLSATRKIRDLDGEYYKNMPIIGLTANAFTSDIKETLASGMNEHMSKPVSLEKIKELLSKYF